MDAPTAAELGAELVAELTASITAELAGAEFESSSNSGVSVRLEPRFLTMNVYVLWCNRIDSTAEQQQRLWCAAASSLDQVDPPTRPIYPSTLNLYRDDDGGGEGGVVVTPERNRNDDGGGGDTRTK